MGIGVNNGKEVATTPAASLRINVGCIAISRLKCADAATLAEKSRHGIRQQITRHIASSSRCKLALRSIAGLLRARALFALPRHLCASL